MKRSKKTEKPAQPAKQPRELDDGKLRDVAGGFDTTCKGVLGG